MSAQVTLHVDGTPPSARALQLETGERFIVLDLGSSVTLMFAEMDLVGVALARQIADVLTTVANEIETAGASDPPRVAPAVEDEVIF